MKWTSAAEAAVEKAPFFVRKKVRRRIEAEARDAGRSAVGIRDVKATQRRYLTGMASEVAGYRLDACFGSSGCPNRAMDAERLVTRIEHLLQAADLTGFLRAQVGDRLKFHHAFRVTVAECPNACSQPQIKDVGIVGVRQPAITPTPCSGCGACTSDCPDRAVRIFGGPDRPWIDSRRCMRCGRCIDGCPTGTLTEQLRGFKVLLAGKLGRHPQLARELPGIYDADTTVDIVRACVDFFTAHSRDGRRFAEIFTVDDFTAFDRRFSGRRIDSGKETLP